VVGICLLTLVPGVVGGSERYARELARALARAGRLDYVALTPSIAADAADGLATRVSARYRASRSLPGRAAAMALAALRPGALRAELGLDNLEVVHYPLTALLPSPGTVPAVTTILDVQHEYHPEFFGRAERLYRRVAYGHAARRAGIVVAISDFVRDTLVERLDVPPERVRTIHLGVDLERFRPGARPREPFLLYPANRWPHKNHARLLEAFALVRRQRPELRLVLTGAGHDGIPLPDGVEARGRVSDDELVGVLQRASALVFPSLYEGFGQPPLEAMACGCPVACSSTTSLPEVVGDAARTFDPTDVEAIAAAVLDVLESPEPWSSRGLERARRFSWDETARLHDNVYAELGAGA
jgi:glycosyltransferase involved in cell wall biosynthesis